MRLKVPMTGTVIDYSPELTKLDGQGIKGDPNDPVAPIPLNLNVSWRLISVDLKNDLMEIEVSPPEEIDEDTGKSDGEGKPTYIRRPATAVEKQQLLDDARYYVESKTVDELYAITGAKRLVKKKAVLDAMAKEKA